MLEHHSGGRCAEALTMSMNLDPKDLKKGAKRLKKKSPGHVTGGDSLRNIVSPRKSSERDNPVDLMPEPRKKSLLCCFFC